MALPTYSGGHGRAGGPSTQHQKEYLSMEVNSASGTAAGNIIQIDPESDEHVCMWGGSFSFAGNPSTTDTSVTYSVSGLTEGVVYQDKIGATSTLKGNPGVMNNFTLPMPVKFIKGDSVAVNVSDITAGSEFYANFHYTVVKG